jgi:hypothetical protein
MCITIQKKARKSSFFYSFVWFSIKKLYNNIIKIKINIMINKIFVFWWIAIWAILIVENIVSGGLAYVFIDSWAKASTLSFVSIVVWMFIWYGLKWMFSKENWDDESYDF